MRQFFIYLTLSFLGLNFIQAQKLKVETVSVAGGTFKMGCTAKQAADCEDDEKTIA